MFYINFVPYLNWFGSGGDNKDVGFRLRAGQWFLLLDSRQATSCLFFRRQITSYLLLIKSKQKNNNKKGPGGEGLSLALATGLF
jgi:hypothetical protein